MKHGFETQREAAGGVSRSLSLLAIWYSAIAAG